MTKAMSQALSNPEIARVMRDAIAHAYGGTMTIADQILPMPRHLYLDQERFELEMKRVFRRVPLALAPSCEIPNPGDYKAMDMAGVPILLVRGKDGVARAFLNACTHRGAKLTVDEHGCAKRFTCRYHGWTFGQAGELLGVSSERDFGSVDRASKSLAALPTTERAGFVFSILDTEAKMDFDDFFFGFDKMLDQFNFKDWFYLGSHKIPGPNWKLNFDATLDTYHVPVLHKDSLAASGDYGNRALFYAWGPHQRMLNADKRIGVLATTPESEWTDMEMLAGIWSLFPNLTIAAFNRGHNSVFGAKRGVMIMQMSPGPTIETSLTTMWYMMEQPPENDEEIERARAQFDMLEHVVRTEDFPVAVEQQNAMKSGLLKEVLYGRNEGGLHTYHGWIEKLVQTEDENLAKLFQGDSK